MVEAVEPPAEVWEQDPAPASGRPPDCPVHACPAPRTTTRVKLPDRRGRIARAARHRGPVPGCRARFEPSAAGAEPQTRTAGRDARGYRFGQPLPRRRRRRASQRKSNAAPTLFDLAGRVRRWRRLTLAIGALAAVHGGLYRRRAIRARLIPYELRPAGLADDVGARARPRAAGWSGRRLATGADRAGVSAYPRHAEANADCAPRLGHAGDGPQL